ncbi:sigma-70 family RNA polymerase sigma factor [Kineococcus glutinatus]|uniref:RNA polymerase sigma factor (Sigma-70 family) n=1 Tax=Kineococcus glutinatus TaxID=1070872 RepID=A0ABP9HEX3_9ACTN
MHDAEDFVRRYFTAVRAIARLEARHPDEAADAESDALLGLHHAARTFQPHRGPEPGWARYKARAEIVNGRRERLHRVADRRAHHADAILAIARPASLDAPVADGGARLADVLPDPDDHLAAVDERLLLQRALGVLTSRQRDVLHRRYTEGELLRSIADDLGVTEGRASQIVAAALGRLRAYFAHPAAEWQGA